MPAFDFPASPTDGQTYTPAGSSVTYTYSNASKVWVAKGTTAPAGISSLTTVQIKAQTSPYVGQFAYSTDGAALCFYNGTAWQKVTSVAL